MIVATEQIRLRTRLALPAVEPSQLYPFKPILYRVIGQVLIQNKLNERGFSDTQIGILSGIPNSAMCVQRFDDSRNSAIHITYRISLRSSSLQEPRDPLLKVVSEH